MTFLGMPQISTLDYQKLPISWYFSDDLLKQEEARLIHALGYVGHEKMLPERGDYRSVSWRDHAELLMHGEHGVALLSNVCRHRQAIMLEGSGNARNIVCPLHRWTYTTDGTLMGAPHFTRKPCLDLPKKPLKAWNGLLFDGVRDVREELNQSAVAAHLNFDGFVFHSIHTEHYPFNWKTFIEVYLEDYHVVPFHPGLGQFVNCDDLSWEFGERYSVQTVGVKNDLKRPGSPVYAQWHEALARFNEGKTPTYGAIWMVLYPNVMVEWYPHTLVVSSVWPDGPEACWNHVEYYYPEEVALFEPDLIAAEQAAYQETAIEDQIICERMTRGRRALLKAGREELGPYQSPMEDGLKHFHDYLERSLA